MKRIILLPFCILTLKIAFGQLEVDKRIDLVGSGSDAKITGIKEVSLAQDAVSAGVLQSGQLITATSVTGNTIITLGFSPAITSATLLTGTILQFKATGNNTGAVTIDVDGPGGIAGIPLMKQTSQPLIANDIQNGALIHFVYDGANFQWLNATGTTIGGSGITGTVTYWSGPNALSSNTNFVWSNSTGRLGVGTAAPHATLHVTAPDAGTNSTLILDGSRTDNKNTLLFRNGFWTPNDAAGMAYIRALDTGTQGGDLAIATTSSGSGAGGSPTERMRVSAAGNVGIGITSPAALLHLHAAAPELRLSQINSDEMALLRIFSKGTNTNARSAIWLQADQNGNGSGAVYIQGLLAANSSSVGLMATDGLMNSLQLYTPQAVPLQLGTADKARITITGTGNVGIGTNVPVVPLHLYSSAGGELVRFQGRTDAANARNYFSLYTTNPGYWWEFSNQDISGGGTQNGLAFRERSGADPSAVRMYLASGGNVGINTVNPQYQLDVTGSLNATTLNGPWDQGGASSGYIRLGKVQIAWGQFTSTSGTGILTTTLPAAFANTTYKLTLTPNPATNAARISVFVTKTTTTFTAQSFQDDGQKSATGGDYIAIGLW